MGLIIMFFSYFLSGFWSNICIFCDFLMIEVIDIWEEIRYMKGGIWFILFRYIVNCCKLGKVNFKYIYIFIYVLVL